jgi:hypothetical protein
MESSNAPEAIMITDTITTYLNRFMSFRDEDQPLTIALWVLHTYTFSESFPWGPWTTPYLYVHSSESRSGKTTLIDLLEPIVLNAERATDMSSAAMFRLIETVQPALFIDEVDTLWSGAKNETMRSTLNGGYKRGGYTWRSVGGEAVKFNTFCPKLLAGIDNGHLPETVGSRCLPIELTRMPTNAATETYYAHLAGPEAEAVSDAIVDFISEYAQHVSSDQYTPKPIDGLNPRHFEIVMPLLQVAHYLNIEEEARAMFLRIFATKPRKDTTEAASLRIIRNLFDELHTEKLHTATICVALGEGWNGKLLGKRITEPLEIGSPTTFGWNGRTAKGYYRFQFEAAFNAHLGD